MEVSLLLFSCPCPANVYVYTRMYGMGRLQSSSKASYEAESHKTPSSDFPRLLLHAALEHRRASPSLIPSVAGCCSWALVFSAFGSLLPLLFRPLPLQWRRRWPPPPPCSRRRRHRAATLGRGLGTPGKVDEPGEGARALSRVN